MELHSCESELTAACSNVFKIVLEGGNGSSTSGTILCFCFSAGVEDCAVVRKHKQKTVEAMNIRIMKKMKIHHLKIRNEY